MKKKNAFTLFLFVAVALCCSIAHAAELPRLFSFKEKKSLDKWQEKIFKGRVLYSVTQFQADGYLIADSKAAASGIFYKLRFKPKKNPMISWKWKVVKFPDKKITEETKSSWIEKDDYAARFYVIFPGLSFKSTRSLEYVWDKNFPEGTIMTSPYFKNIKIIVAESGSENLGKWVFEERNVYEDFKKAFGEEKSVPSAGAIAIMTDTDNSISTAEAHYDEVKVGYKNEEE